MIEDLIELAHAKDLVHGTWLEPDACDAYRLRALPRPITFWVRPDGRFSRAMADDELLTLGQVMRGLLAVVQDDGLDLPDPGLPTGRLRRSRPGVPARR